MDYTQRKYERQEETAKLGSDLERVETSRPGAYSSKWRDALDSAIGRILSRPDFSYDLGSDPLYRQYRESYGNQGRQAMMDTLGQAATLTGGYGNSYAQVAGQQAYGSYLQQLNDRIPELYQLALDRYTRQGQDLYDQAALLGDQEQRDYSRYQDAYNAWSQEREYLAGRYDTQRDFDYGAYRDAVGDDQWIAAFEEDRRRYDQEWAAEHPEAVPGGDEDGGSRGSRGSGKKSAASGGQDVDIEAEYLAMKRAGGETALLDKFLKSAVASGKITQRAATDLRDKRV